MSEEKTPRKTRHIADFDDQLGPVSLRRLDRALIIVFVLFIPAVMLDTFTRINAAGYYEMMRDLHYHISRFGLGVALFMFAIAIYIGLIRHADVTPYFRRGAYVTIGIMVFQSLLGAIMYFIIGTRPGDDIHLIYGMATVLALPFFIFVEKTAEKRPAMGSYMWGFIILAGVIIRSIGTGAPG